MEIYFDNSATTRVSNSSAQRALELMQEEFGNPYKAAECGKFEDVIEPADTRRVIIRTLELFRNKQVSLPLKKHGNIPV